MNAPIIVLIAHGAPRFPQVLAFFQALADQVAAQGAKVHILMMRGEPSVDQFAAILASTPPETPIVVVPLFLADGYYTNLLVPRTLGLDTITSHPVTYTAPLGCHPDFAAYVQQTALDACPFPAAETQMLLVAHGSRQGKPETTAQNMARQIRGFTDVKIAYLEQEPWARDWAELFPHGKVLVMPLLLAPGQHGSQDIPDLIPCTPVIPDKRSADPGSRGSGKNGVCDSWIPARGRDDNVSFRAALGPSLPLNDDLVRMVTDLCGF